MAAFLPRLYTGRVPDALINEARLRAAMFGPDSAAAWLRNLGFAPVVIRSILKAPVAAEVR